jgi:hypothetical protein
VIVPLWLLVASIRSAPQTLDALQQRDAPVAVLVDSTATWHPVTPASVTVHLDEERPADVVAPPWKGTVTAVLARPGQTLRAGDPVLEIDGVRRLFAPSPAPLWRVPAWGDRGPDIDGLAALLTTLSLLPAQPAGTAFGADHVLAVERLARLVGARPSSTLDLGWLVWSPVPTVEVPSWSVALGGPAPAPGATLVALPRTITAVEVLAPDGSRLADAAVRQATIDLGADGDVAGAELLDAPDHIAALRGPAEQGSGGGGPPGGAGAPGAAPGAAASAASPTRTLRAMVRGAPVPQVAALPLSAVVTDGDGSHCLVALDRTPVPIELIGSDVARVYVRGADGQQVAANPASAFGVTSCH